MTFHKDKEFVLHILDMIRKIEVSVKNISREDFISNPDIVDANIRRLEIIGEAVKNLSESFRNEHKDVEWNKISGTRDVLIHRYFEVDLDIAWDIIQEDLPKLKEQIESILKKT